ncbi:unnamed protein product [Rotaria sp. Silwood2]|nr:unnamed protein product [Rotaria sp. Silwood2]CAF4155267.1 unnamed protein product [Rotaria sp. Silwood2]
MQAIHLLVVYIINGFYALALPNRRSLNIFTTPRTLSNCTEKYGDQPATPIVSLNNIFTILNYCADISGHVIRLDFTDSNDDPRQACLLVTSFQNMLPLLVWLHPSIFPSGTIVFTNLLSEAYTANLTGTADGPLGYHLLLPFGRNTTHVYPSPDDQGLGWDNWYRNYNRSDPTLNVDVQTLDYFINQVVNDQSNMFHIDKSRVFMSGWSNGAAMAVQYTLNTPGIAAAAVYSAPDPYRDYKDPCAQIPYPSYLTPVRILYNQCDIINICATGMAFINDLNKRYMNNLTAEGIIIDSLLEITSTCNLNCTDEFGLGLMQHSRWPTLLNDKIFFEFFRQHSLVSNK